MIFVIQDINSEHYYSGPNKEGEIIFVMRTQLARHYKTEQIAGIEALTLIPKLGGSRKLKVIEVDEVKSVLTAEKQALFNQRHKVALLNYHAALVAIRDNKVENLELYVTNVLTMNEANVRGKERL